MNTGGTAQLCNTHDRGLDILTGDHHQVRELVNDNDKVGHLLRRIVVMLKLASSLLFVVGRDLTHVETLEDLQATLHLGHSPLQSARGLLGSVTTAHRDAAGRYSPQARHAWGRP